VFRHGIGICVHDEDRYLLAVCTHIEGHDNPLTGDDVISKM
jgi:hypothetical protein